VPLQGLPKAGVVSVPQGAPRRSREAHRRITVEGILTQPGPALCIMAQPGKYVAQRRLDGALAVPHVGRAGYHDALLPAEGDRGALAAGLFGGEFRLRSGRVELCAHVTNLVKKVVRCAVLAVRMQAAEPAPVVAAHAGREVARRTAVAHRCVQALERADDVDPAALVELDDPAGLHQEVEHVVWLAVLCAAGHPRWHRAASG